MLLKEQKILFEVREGVRKTDERERARERGQYLYKYMQINILVKRKR